jgi:hypothetical protein
MSYCSELPNPIIISMLEDKVFVTHLQFCEYPTVGMDWQVVEWVVDEWCSEWVKSDKCKVYLLYCIDISGECPFVFVKIGAPQKRPMLVSKHSCTHCYYLSPSLLLFLAEQTTKEVSPHSMLDTDSEMEERECWNGMAGVDWFIIF